MILLRWDPHVAGHVNPTENQLESNLTFVHLLKRNGKTLLATDVEKLNIPSGFCRYNQFLLDFFGQIEFLFLMQHTAFSITSLCGTW